MDDKDYDNLSDEDILEELEELAKLCWLYVSEDDHSILHAKGELKTDPAYWNFQEGTLACGMKVEYAEIPGMFSRMGKMRCEGCCEAMGYPKGKGSPKNDNECRKILGLSISEEGGDG